jgi:hypothetical protein
VDGEDRLSAVYAAVPDQLSSPWDADRRYRFDRELLEKLIAAQAAGGTFVPASGALANAVDVWIATELRRSGIDEDAVWPRSQRPRLLPQALARAVRGLRLSASAETRAIQEATIGKLVRSAGSGGSNILGGFFLKEIDVVIAEYDRGLELGVSTKTMTGSAAKNVANRFEEAAGDLLNIRRRYPLATFGYCYLVTANVPREEPAAWERIKDMCRKLKSLSTADETASYDATCLIVLELDGNKIQLNEDLVPEDLSPDGFFETLLTTLFSRSPVSEHTAARDLWVGSLPAE